MYPLFWGALVGLLGSLFVKVGGLILQVVRHVMPIVQRVFEVIRNALVAVGTNAGRFFRAISNAVRSVYNNVVAPIIDSVRRFYDKFQAFLKRVFGPVIKVIDAVQRTLVKIWDKVIAPILSFLDKVRLALAILAKLGVPWAERLGEIVASIQREIFNRFRQVQNWVNRATWWLDILLDPRGWIKSTPFLYTIFRYAGNVVNLLTKLADPAGLHNETLVQNRVDNPTSDVDLVAKRVKSGETRASWAVQYPAARFRARRSGRGI